jgi:hypothetical protein
MTVFLLVLALLVALAFIYALVLRPWLKKQSWAQGYFTAIEPFEIALFKKSEPFWSAAWCGSAACSSLPTMASRPISVPSTSRR